MSSKQESPLWSLRAPTLDDLPEAVEMFNLCARKMTGVDEVTLERYQLGWTSPQLSLVDDARVAVTADGKIVGEGEVWCNDPYTFNWVWARVHPDYENQGIGTALLRFIEQRARETMVKAEPDTRVYIRVATYPNEAATQLFLNEGYVLVRHGVWLERAMPEPPEPSIVPEGIVIRPMVAPDEYEAVHRTDIASFRDHWGFIERPFEESYADFRHYVEVEDHDPSLWFVAMDGEQMAGIALCRLQAESDTETGWVDTLGVHPAWRKRGIGAALLQYAFAELYRRGQRRVQLSADAENLTGALRLYHRAGMEVIRTATNYEKELRAGRELQTR